MVRTASSTIRTGGGKNTKGHIQAARSSGVPVPGPSSSSRRSVGGNRPQKQPIPSWQKPITKFFPAAQGRSTVDDDDDDDDEGSTMANPPVEEKPESRPEETGGSSSSTGKSEKRAVKVEATVVEADSGTGDKPVIKEEQESKVTSSVVEESELEADKKDETTAKKDLKDSGENKGGEEATTGDEDDDYGIYGGYDNKNGRTCIPKEQIQMSDDEKPIRRQGFDVYEEDEDEESLDESSSDEEEREKPETADKKVGADTPYMIRNVKRERTLVDARKSADRKYENKSKSAVKVNVVPAATTVKEAAEADSNASTEEIDVVKDPDTEQASQKLSDDDKSNGSSDEDLEPLAKKIKLSKIN